MAAVPHKAGGVSKRSTKPSYDATISSWAAIKIKGEAWMYSLGFINALRKPEQASLRVRESIDQPEQASLRVRESPEQASLRVRESKDTTPPSASTRGWSNENEKGYYIMTQNVFVMSEYQDSTNILGPFNARTLLYMLEDGQIDRNTSLIKRYGSPGTTEFWQPISDDIEHGLHNQNKPGKMNQNNHLGVISAGHQNQNQNQSPGADKGINMGLLEQYNEINPIPLYMDNKAAVHKMYIDTKYYKRPKVRFRASDKII